MKVYVGTDLEGVAGVVTFYSQTSPSGAGYEAAKRLLTAEINAAVEGMLQEGVDDILVSDGHGPGAIHYESLHPEAKLIHGRPPAPRAIRDAIIEEYDVCIMLGQHALAGNPRANMNHTQNSHSIDYYQLNGTRIGEIAQFALYQGALGLPLIFLSGDEEACREAEELVPGIATAAVKRSLSRNSAISLSPQKSHELIRAGAAKAIRSQRENPLPPVAWPGPYVLEKRYFHTDAADAAGGERIDGQTVRLRADNIRDIVYR